MQITNSSHHATLKLSAVKSVVLRPNAQLPIGLFNLHLKQGFFSNLKTACSSTWAAYSQGFACRQQNIYAF